MSDDGKVGIISDLLDLLVDHKAEDSELGGTSVVELDGTLGELFLLIELVPSEVDVSVTEVTNELVSGSWDILHDGDLEESDEADDLSNSVERNGIRSLDGGDSVGVGVEGVSSVVNVSWKVDSGTGKDVSKEGKHGNTSVLDLDVSETVETFLVSTVQKTKRVPESKRRLDSEFLRELRGLDGSAGGLLGSRGESSGGGDKGGKDGGLHVGCWFGNRNRL